MAEDLGSQAGTSDHCSWPTGGSILHSVPHSSPTQTGQKALKTPGKHAKQGSAVRRMGDARFASKRVTEARVTAGKAFSLGREKRRGRSKEPPSIKNKAK